MIASAPTCPTCGAVLIGYGWSDELQFQVHFCPRCREKEETPQPKGKPQVVEKGVMDEAA